jgi:hypothetical protein
MLAASQPLDRLTRSQRQWVGQWLFLHRAVLERYVTSWECRHPKGGHCPWDWRERNRVLTSLALQYNSMQKAWVASSVTLISTFSLLAGHSKNVIVCEYTFCMFMKNTSPMFVRLAGKPSVSRLVWTNTCKSAGLVQQGLLSNWFSLPLCWLLILQVVETVSANSNDKFYVWQF